MLSKEELRAASKCNCNGCDRCDSLKEFEGVSDCVASVAQTALQLLNRVETLEQLLRDVLVSGNVKSCEREIREVLEGSNEH